MYYVVNRRGEYLSTDTVPCRWAESIVFALGYKLSDEAKRTIRRLWPLTAKAIGAEVVWEENDMARGAYVVLAVYQGSAPDPYEVRRGGDGVLYCTCRGWVMNKNNRSRSDRDPAACKHTKNYVAEHPGTSYGAQYIGAQQYVAPAKSGKSYSTFSPEIVSKIANAGKPTVSPPTATVAAGSDWRAQLLAEKREAAGRGIVTPREALSAYAKELDLDE